MIDCFFTICSANYLGKAKALKYSISKLYPKTTFVVFLVDEIAGREEYFGELDFEIVLAKDLNFPDFDEMKNFYNITEMNTAVKPYAFRYLFENQRNCLITSAVYLDPDVYLYSRLKEVEEAFNAKVNLILTPHILEPDFRSLEKSKTYLRHGIFNLGFLGMRRSYETHNLLKWWAMVLARDCRIDISDNLFVDQKWADLFISFTKNYLILRHAGYNIAYWNLHERKIQSADGQFKANDVEIRFIHFSGLSFEEGEITQRVLLERQETYSEFIILKSRYLNLLKELGDPGYSKIKYSYSLGGFYGENLHTPISSKSKKSNRSRLTSILLILWAFKENGFFFRKIRKIFVYLLTGDFRAVRRGVGYWFRLASNSNSSLITPSANYGLLALKKLRDFKIREAKDSLLQAKLMANHQNSLRQFEPSRMVPNEEVLFIDWSLPQPDNDAASVTTIELIRILKKSNFNITFIPSNLMNTLQYRQLLESIGVRVITTPEISSVSEFLENYGRLFGQIWVSRSPIAYPLLSVVKKNSPDSKFIFNSVDLHFLREERQAVLMKSIHKRNESKKTKKQELELIKAADASILLSNVEMALVKNILPQSNLVNISLIFPEREFNSNTFKQRNGIIFVGGFSHEPNLDGITWFLEEVYGFIENSNFKIPLSIVGANPSKSLIKLASRFENVKVLGQVGKLDGVLEKARISIAPLRFGAGVKGKIGNAMRFGLPTISTTIGVEGMDLQEGVEVLVADASEDFAHKIIELHNDELLWNMLSKASFDGYAKRFTPEIAEVKILKMLKNLGVTPSKPDKKY